MADALDRIPGVDRAGIRRLALQLAFTLALVGLVGVGLVVEGVPRPLYFPVVAALVPLYFAAEDPDGRDEFLRMAGYAAVAGAAAGVASTLVA